MNVSQLDPRRLGLEMIRLLSTSIALGHSTPARTIRDYYHPESPEGEFIRDFVPGEGRKFFISRWFDGDEVAAGSILTLSMRCVLGPERAEATASP